MHASCSVPDPGLIRHHHGAGLIAGEPDHSVSPRIRALAGVLEAGGFEVTVSDSIHVGAVREIGAAVSVPSPATDTLYGLTRLHARVAGLTAAGD